MKKIFLSSIIVKFTVSFCIILIIPLVVSGMLLYSSLKYIIGQDISKYSTDMLSSAKATIDSRIEELNNISFQASRNSKLRSLKLSNDYTLCIEAVKELSNMVYTSNFCNDLFLYYKEQSLIYSSNGTYRVDQFTDYIYNFESWDSQRYISDMNLLNKITVKPSEQVRIMSGPSEKYLTYIIPFPTTHSSPDGALFFMIKESKFQQMFADILNTSKGSILIFESNNNLISSYGNNCDEFRSTLDSRILNEDSSFKKINLNNNEYSISSIKSNSTGWTYVIITPIYEITGKMRPIITKALTSLFITVLLGILSITYLAKINYKPIRELKGFALDIFGENIECENELETVKIAVNHMSDKICNLQRKVDLSAPSLKSTVLAKLIKGSYYDFTDFNKDAQDAGINLNEGLYAVVILLLTGEIEYDSSIIINHVEKIHIDNIKIYGINILENNNFVLLISSNRFEEGKMNSSVLEIKNSLKENFGLDATFGAGNWVYSLTSIGSSYMQASSALDYRFIKGRNTIIFYKEVENLSNDKEYYPKEQLELLETSILHGDEKKVTDILTNIFDKIKNSELPIFIVRSLCYNIISTINNSVYKMKANLNSRDLKYSDIALLTSYETIEELFEHTNKFCSYICSFINQNKKSESNKIDKIIEFININCYSQDFSLQNMSRQFYMSVSGISTYFKLQCGENISDYVNRLRIEKAKDLLTNTDCSIQEIVTSVGYISTSSFIRKFREYMAVTPGKYRELTKKA